MTAEPAIEAAMPIHADPALPELTRAAAKAADTLTREARAILAAKVSTQGRVSGLMLEAAQYAAHGLAWLATYAEALAQMAGWAGRLEADGKFGEMERLLLAIGAGEYLAQIAGGIPMSQGEIVRPAEIGVGEAALAAFRTEPAVARLAQGNTDSVRMRLVGLMAAREGAATFGDCGLDEEFEMVRDQFRR